MTYVLVIDHMNVDFALGLLLQPEPVSGSMAACMRKIDINGNEEDTR